MSRWVIGLRLRWSRNDQVTTAVKATIAALSAWIFARYLLGHENPYFAPISALVSVQATVVRSLREGVRFAVCFALGVVVAMASAEVLGPGLISLAISLFAGTLLGGWSRFGAQGLEVPFTATFLLLGGAHPEHLVIGRLTDVAAGVSMGIAVNVFLLAPLHLTSAADALDRTADDIAALLDDMADGLTESWPVRNARWFERCQTLDKALRDTLDRMSHARESVRLNPRRTAEPRRPPLNELLWDCFADIRRSIQSIAHTLGDVSAEAAAEPDRPSWLDEGFRAEYAELLRKVALVIDERLRPAPRSRPGVSETRQALKDLREEVYTRPGESRAPWYTQSHLLIEISRILKRVCDTIDAGERVPAMPTLTWAGLRLSGVRPGVRRAVHDRGGPALRSWTRHLTTGRHRGDAGRPAGDQGR